MRPIVNATPIIETTRIVGSKEPISIVRVHLYLGAMLLPTSLLGLEPIDHVARVKLLNWN